MIASKNVSILVRDQNDIVKFYKEDRYQFARLIGETWFGILGNMEKKDVEVLKKELSEKEGKTMVGEYCGNPDFQHLVKYDKTTIYFYAVVEN